MTIQLAFLSAVLACFDMEYNNKYDNPLHVALSDTCSAGCVDIQCCSPDMDVGPERRGQRLI